jgi:hypothetical protein
MDDEMLSFVAVIHLQSGIQQKLVALQSNFRQCVFVRLPDEIPVTIEYLINFVKLHSKQKMLH